MNTENRSLWPVLFIGFLVAAIFITGIGLGYYSFLGWRALNAMLGLGAIASFFGILALPGGWSEGRGFTEARVRLALTSTLVMLYVLYFSTAIFWFGTPESEPSPLGETLFTTLSNLLMVVVPFYFGTTAATEIARTRSRAAPAPAVGSGTGK